MRHDLFSTPVWHIEGAPQQLVEELYQGVNQLKEIHPSNRKTNLGGYQSPPFEWKDFHPKGIEYIERVVGNLIGTEIRTVQSYKSFKVPQWWCNINGKGDWNLPHTHQFVDYALVFYLTDSDKLLNFMNPHPQSPGNLHYNSIDAKKGDILIFPADLLHFVLPNERDTNRVCISMNLQLC
tara:strand:+ start:61 stop:600 length:540 start_codon:yes stop_codon:yes gene_type:complete